MAYSRCPCGVGVLANGDNTHTHTHSLSPSLSPFLPLPLSLTLAFRVFFSNFVSVCRSVWLSVRERERERERVYLIVSLSHSRQSPIPNLPHVAHFFAVFIRLWATQRVRPIFSAQYVCSCFVNSFTKSVWCEAG